MSKLNDLIQSLCPDGVENKTINSVCKLSAGGDVPRGRFSLNRTEVNQIPIYSNGIGENALYGWTDKAIIASPSVTISARGTIGHSELREESFFPVVRLLCLTPYDSVNVRFLNYALQNIHFEVPTSGIPQLTIPMIAKYLIPLPPLEVQKEIVRILDKFTILEAELEAELEARLLQYTHYRNEFLKFEEDSLDKWRTLGDVSLRITKGTTPSAFEETGISFIKTEAFEGSRINKSKLSYVSPSVHMKELKRSILEVNDILFAIAGSLGKCGIITEDILPANTNQALAIIRLKNEVNRNFVLQLLKSKRMTDYISRNIKGSAQPNLNLEQMNNFPVPVLPKEEQYRIADTLDRFEAIVSDISSGLPAEIAARHKQYEYYRNQLLTFQPKPPLQRGSESATNGGVE